MENARSPHDPSYKQFFSNPDMVASLLRDLVPEDFVNDLDFSTLEQCSGSYVTDDLRDRHDDIIWRLRWRDSWMYLYLLLEFQSTIDPWMAVRILAYTALLWQDLIKSGTVRDGESLPPVLPIVIYNGRKPWTAAQDVAELLPPIRGPLRRYQPRQSYFLLDEGRVPEDLLHTGGLAAQLVRLERADSLEALRPIVRELVAQLQNAKYRHLRRMLSVWLGRVVFKRAGITTDVPEFHDLQEIDAMLEERAAQWKDEYIRQGILIGEARGEAMLEERAAQWKEEYIRQGILIGEARGEAMLEERAAQWKEEYIRQGILIGEARGEAMLEERAAQWKDEYTRQGILIGEARGRTEGEAWGEARGLGLALRDVLEFRFGRLPVSVSSRIAELSDAVVLRKLTLSAYQADSLQAFVDQLSKDDTKKMQ